MKQNEDLINFLLRYTDLLKDINVENINETTFYNVIQTKFSFINGKIYFNSSQDDLIIRDYSMYYLNKIYTKADKNLFLNNEKEYPRNYTELPFKFVYSNSDFTCFHPLKSLKNIPSYTNGTVYIYGDEVIDWGYTFGCRELRFNQLIEPPLEQMHQFINDQTCLNTNDNSPWVIAIKLINQQLDTEDIHNKISTVEDYHHLAELLEKLGRSDLYSIRDIPFINNDNDLGL